MDVFTASLRSSCSLRCRHFVNNLGKAIRLPFLYPKSLSLQLGCK
ncbi:gluconate 5-dehydrogenase [Yersinia similis]|nr:gluconate 5-dehydrogenase [Yersinia similis]